MRKPNLTFGSLLLLALFTAVSPLETAAQEKVSKAKKGSASKGTQSLETGTVLGAAQLHSMLPQTVQGYSLVGEGLDFKEGASEVWSSFYNEDADSVVHVFLADLAQAPDLYEGFLSARGIVQGSTGNAFGLDTSDRATDFGLILSQSTGRGVVELGQFSDLVRVDLDSVTVSDGEKELGIQQVTAELNQATLSASDLAIPVMQVSASEGQDGSFINVHENAEQDVAGWEIYDVQTRTGALLLGVGGRFGLLIEGSSIGSLAPLNYVLSQIPVGALEQLTAGVAE